MLFRATQSMLAIIFLVSKFEMFATFFFFDCWIAKEFEFKFRILFCVYIKVYSTCKRFDKKVICLFLPVGYLNIFLIYSKVHAEKFSQFVVCSFSSYLMNNRESQKKVIVCKGQTTLSSHLEPSTKNISIDLLTFEM